MSRSVANLALLAFACAAANGAALVSVPAKPQPLLPAPGLEANQGQANAAILFLSPASNAGIAITAQTVLFSPIGATLNLAASNSNPAVTFSDPLPGFANSYTGADPAKWITGIHRYTTATLTAIYPGIDAQYTIDATGVLTLNLLLAPGASLDAVQFVIPNATIRVGSSGLIAAFGIPGYSPALGFPPPQASQANRLGQMNVSATFMVQSTTSFTVAVEGADPTLPLRIAIQLNAPAASTYIAASQHAVDAAGNTYYAAPAADAAGKTPTPGSLACSTEVPRSIPCMDVAVYKYSSTGTLQFITYLAGSVNDSPGFLGLTPKGQIAVAGATDSTDFPVTAGAFQTNPSAGGNLFAAILDAAAGTLQCSTFLGGTDAFPAATIGTDGSLYFLPAFAVNSSAGMPTSSGALLPACQSDPCLNGYAARLSPSLDKLIYGTYLPGVSQATAQLYEDGSVYFAGRADAGFPVTPGAFQTQNAGGDDGMLARLDPTGTHLLFATYYGTPQTDWILSIALAPDGSVWANVNSFLECCINIQPQLIHLDASGSHLLAAVPINADAMVVDSAGNLIALAEGSIAVSPNAILGGSCGGPAYVELSPGGDQLFATYLPSGFYGVSFDGADANGDPYIVLPSGRAQVVQNQSAPPNVGCIVDTAGFTYYPSPRISPGGIMTIFGAGMGPAQGVSFQLVNGHVPTSLAGTQVLINGEAAPLLYASYGQLNLLVPYDLAPGTTADIQVVTNAAPLNLISNVPVVAADISVFQVNGAAVALNQDYTVNSAQNPAQPGSVVMLFCTGGGQTSPPSTAGEVTPLVLRPLVNTPQAAILDMFQMEPPVIDLNVQYAAAAPALLAGVDQINLTLPAAIPMASGYPPGTLPVQVFEPGLSSYQVVTIYTTAPSPAKL